MALFSKKTKVTKAPKAEAKAEKTTSGAAAPIRKDYLQGIIIRPRITEKATVLVEKGNVYVFEINNKATKPLVSKAVQSLYNVVPAKVTIVRNPSKTVMVRNRPGTKAGVKKAYVYLKKGEKIEFA